MSGPLGGIRVLDLARVLSGPSCGRALLELGAEVIKVEPPEGDTTRHAHPRIGGYSVYFAQQNAGKRFVAIDLATGEGRMLALDLAAASDVVLENFRPGVADRLGLGYEAVRERNPGVVYCSITGYGQTGPAAQRRAYAGVVHAETGYTELTSRKRGIDLQPEPVAVGDTFSGLQGVVGILAALVERGTTGSGQHVDVAMADTMLSVNEWTASELAGGDGGHVQLFGGMRTAIVETADGTTVMVPGDPAVNFKSWARAFERLDLIEDPRFANKTARDENREDMMVLLREWAGTCADFERFSEAVASTPLAPGAVTTIPEVVDADWARHRGAITAIALDDADVDGDGAEIAVPQIPIRFSGHEPPHRGGPRRRGADNSQVLADVLGLGEAEISKLRAAGALVDDNDE